MTPPAALKYEQKPMLTPHFSAQEPATYSFGQFKLQPALRRLERDGTAVRIGARAFDLLHLLVENAGETVPKRTIWDRVWPNLHVSDGNLRFQLVELRRILAKGNAQGCIVAVPGRGYCFAAPLKSRVLPAAQAACAGAISRLPPRLERMIGRSEALEALHGMLDGQRLVTIVGSGGIGKTTLAIAAAHDRLKDEDGAITLVDVGAVLDSGLVVSSLAAALGLAVQSSDPLSDIVRHLRSRKTLLILDSAEHVLDTVAILAERLLHDVARLQLLVTSREALRIEGEHVLLLPPFEEPTAEQAASLSSLLRNPAAELLVERAFAADSQLRFTDADAPSIAALCRSLDGVALAIELAAGRIPTHGLKGTTELLAGRLDHLRGGRRTAPARHASLRHTLAWSYDLLDETARLVLRRLSIFVGPFSLTAACAIASDADVDPTATATTLDDLAAKSLVSVRRGSDVARFRLLDTTKAFLQEQISREEWSILSARHAAYFAAILHPEREDSPEVLRATSPLTLEDLPNIRAALAWCHPQPGLNRGGTRLATGAAVLLQRLSLLAECQDVCQAAIAALLPTEMGTRDELELQTCLAQSLMYGSGHGPQVLAAFQRALALAAKLGETERELAIANALHVYYNRCADFEQGLAIAEHAYRIAQARPNSASAALGQISLGIALHHIGRHQEASLHLDKAVILGERTAGIDRIASYATHPNRARVILAQNLWVRGLPDSAARLARKCIDEAAELNHELSLAVALSGVPPVFMWRGDWAEVEALLDRHCALAEQNSLHPYRALVTGRRGEMAIRTGKAKSGLPMVCEALERLDQLNYRLFSTPLRISLAEGLLQIGEETKAFAEIHACQVAIENGGDALYLPEVLRIKAMILADLPRGRDDVEQMLHRALLLAQSQGALSLQLRVACTMTSLQSGKPAEAEAAAILTSVLGRFSEGMQTGDLRAALGLLERRNTPAVLAAVAETPVITMPSAGLV